MSKVFCANAKCFSRAKFSCGRCDMAAYCGKQCQLIDFSSHRFNCFEMPSLNPLKVSDKAADPTPCLKEKNETIDSTQPAVVKNARPITNVQAKVVIEEAPKPKVVDVIPKPVERKVSEPPKQIPPPLPKPQRTEFNLATIRRTHQTVATFPPKPKEDPKVFLDDLKIIPLPAKVQFRANIFVGDRDTKIFAIAEASNSVQQILASIELAVQEAAASDDKPYKPQKNEVVLAKYEGIFYRAVCLDIENDEYTVHYIDYGNYGVIQDKDIRAFNKKVPMETAVHSCYFDNFPDDVTEKVADLLNQDTVLLKGAYNNGQHYCVSIVGL